LFGSIAIVSSACGAVVNGATICTGVGAGSAVPENIALAPPTEAALSRIGSADIVTLKTEGHPGLNAPRFKN